MLNLKKKMFQPRSRRYGPIVNLSDNTNRAEKYKFWSDYQMEHALDAVQRALSIRRAAEEFNVPKSTLGDSVSGQSVVLQST